MPLNETQLLVLTTAIKTETNSQANTALRVGTALEEIVKNTVNKQGLFAQLATVTGVNPALTFASANLLTSFNIAQNLVINLTSTTAIITIEDDSVGLGQVLSCYVNNLSASNVAITLTCVDDIKYPQNLDTGVSRAGNVITISASKEYLITFLRSKAGVWSFNILEQNS